MFFSLHARLCAESPRLATLLTLSTLVISQGFCGAAELELASESASTSVSTNGPAVGETNSFSLLLSQRPINFSLAGAASVRSEFSSPQASVGFVLIRTRPTGLAGSTGSIFSRQPGNGNFRILSFETGYGQAYDPDSVALRKRNGTGLEEPRYVFFKRVVKF